MSGRLRLFFGIPVEDSMRTQLLYHARKLGGDELWRYTAQENLHLTLCFLGKRESSEREKIIEVAGDFIDKYKWPRLTIDRIQMFPERNPKFIWAVLKDNQGLSHLANSLESRFNNDVLRDFIPHITLARYKGSKPVKFESGESPGNEYRYNSIVLYNSELSTDGPSYTAIHRWEP